MSPSLKAKIKYYAYYASLAIVAIFVLVGFYMKKKNPDPTQNKAKMEMSKDSSLVVKEGDRVNIDFVGYVDGKEIEDGSTEGNGLDITVGDGKLLPGMEEQLIGHHPGETYTITITFADDYKQKGLRGKEATLDMTINAIYVPVEEESVKK